MASTLHLTQKKSISEVGTIYLVLLYIYKCLSLLQNSELGCPQFIILSQKKIAAMEYYMKSEF